MPLNLNPNSGEDFIPYLKYNSKAGRWYAKFDGYQNEIEVQNPVLIFDFPNIKTGWISFASDGPPNCVWDASLEQEAPRPESDKAKRGFQVVVVGRQPVPAAGKLALGAREFMGVAASIVKPVKQMFDEWEEASKEHQGELPAYQCTGVVPVVGNFGTNYTPEFKLMGWRKREEVPELNSITSSHHGNGEQPDPEQSSQADEPFVDDDIPF